MFVVVIFTPSNKTSTNGCFQAAEAKGEVKDEKADEKTKQAKQEEEEEIPQLVPIATPVKKSKLKVSSLLSCFESKDFN